MEFSLVILPLFLFSFLIFSISWIFFAKASLEFAVREGCRAAITQSLTDTRRQSIQSVVQNASFGFIKNTTDVKVDEVQNGGIDLVTVHVDQIPVSIVGGGWFTKSPIKLSASSSDALEGPPT